MKISNIYLRILMSLQENESKFSFTMKDGVEFVTVLGRTKMVQFLNNFISANATVLPNKRKGKMVQFLNNYKIKIFFILVLLMSYISLVDINCELNYALVLVTSFIPKKREVVTKTFLTKPLFIKVIKRDMLSRTYYMARTAYHATTALFNNDMINQLTKDDHTPLVHTLSDLALDPEKGIDQLKTSICNHMIAETFSASDFYSKIPKQIGDTSLLL